MLGDSISGPHRGEALAGRTVQVHELHPGEGGPCTRVRPPLAPGRAQGPTRGIYPTVFRPLRGGLPGASRLGLAHEGAGGCGARYQVQVVAASYRYSTGPLSNRARIASTGPGLQTGDGLALASDVPPDLQRVAGDFTLDRSGGPLRSLCYRPTRRELIIPAMQPWRKQHVWGRDEAEPWTRLRLSCRQPVPRRLSEDLGRGSGLRHLPSG